MEFFAFAIIALVMDKFLERLEQHIQNQQPNIDAVVADIALKLKSGDLSSSDLPSYVRSLSLGDQEWLVFTLLDSTENLTLLDVDAVELDD